jgi:threonine dehydrogenase-like Zn-dependent dehydrogenase
VPVQKILDVTDGLGVDVALEMSGHPLAIRQSFKVLRNGGRVSLLGLPSNIVELDLRTISSSKAQSCLVSLATLSLIPGIARGK